MRLQVGDKDAEFAKVINLDMGKEIKFCIWADDETGEYERYVTDESNQIVLFGDEFQTVTEKARIKIEIQKP